MCLLNMFISRPVRVQKLVLVFLNLLKRTSKSLFCPVSDDLDLGMSFESRAYLSWHFALNNRISCSSVVRDTTIQAVG